MNRGARKQTIFPEEEGYIAFINLLGELPGRFRVRIHGFALMPNHFHLMVESVRGNLSQAMQYLQSRYSAWLNHRHEWDGSLYKGRFKNRVVEDDIYWLHLLAYIHLNWVRAHLATSPDETEWTSHGAYVGLAPVPEWLTTHELQAGFGTRAAYVQYLEDVQRKREQAPEGFEKVLFYPSPWNEPRAKPGAGGGRLLSPEEAIAAVELVTACSRDELSCGRRGRGRVTNRARWIAMWFLNEATPLSQVAIGRMLGAAPAVVSRSVARVRDRRDMDEIVEGWQEKLSDLLGDRPAE